MSVVVDPISSVGPLPRPDVLRRVARTQEPSPGKTPMHLLPGLLRLVPVAVVALVLAPAARAQNPAPADGIFVTVNNPITEGVISQVKSQVDAVRNDPRRNIKTVVFNFNPEGRDAATEFFGTSYELAKYVKSLRANGLRTIAFVQGKTTRHTVLPAV